MQLQFFSKTHKLDRCDFHPCHPGALHTLLDDIVFRPRVEKFKSLESGNNSQTKGK